jgi:hypothetical protein
VREKNAAEDEPPRAPRTRRMKKSGTKNEREWFLYSLSEFSVSSVAKSPVVRKRWTFYFSLARAVREKNAAEDEPPRTPRTRRTKTDQPASDQKDLAA